VTSWRTISEERLKKSLKPRFYEKNKLHSYNLALQPVAILATWVLRATQKLQEFFFLTPKIP
jgi:hypothetical protein